MPRYRPFATAPCLGKKALTGATQIPSFKKMESVFIRFIGDIRGGPAVTFPNDKQKGEAMIGLTFLGTGDYQETGYLWNGRQVTTALFPEAFVAFFNLSELYVVVTPESREKHLARLRQRLGDGVNIHEIEIPFGYNEEELWTMFERISGEIPAGVNLVIDITHGFRSQPLLILAACVYLQVARQVKIERIVYGAYEAGNRQAKATPVFDLTPFLNIIDWSMAVDKFVKSGNAADLAALLTAAHRQPYTKTHAKTEGLPHYLSSLARQIEATSLALRAVRPHGTFKKAAKMVNTIDTMAAEVETWAKPFALLLDRVKDEYRPMAVPDAAQFTAAGMHGQLAMIHWYLEKGLYMQAITLAREFLVSHVCLVMNMKPSGFESRKLAAENLNDWNNTIKNRTKLNEDVSGFSKKDTAKLWGEVIELRNDINHAGMSKAPKPADTLLKKIERVCSKLERMFEHAH